MPDFLTRRNGTWHFVRRVPAEFTSFDQRSVIRHSTKVRVAEDRNGRRASRIAQKLNEQLEGYWCSLAHGLHDSQISRYEAARRRARTLGFEYLENDQLIARHPEKRLERLEALVTKGVVDDPTARAALLGTEKRSVFLVSKLFEEYQSLVEVELKGMSPNQLRCWRLGRIRAVRQFVEVTGDKPVTDITQADGLDYVDWWRERVIAGEAATKTANRDIGQLSRMLKDMAVRRRHSIPDIFKGLSLRGGADKSRSPFDPNFIQGRFLSAGALDGLNEDARYVLYVLMETGLRLSEVVNLQPNAIHLDGKIPYVRIQPDGRRLKTEDSIREIPLVGVALKAMQLRPNGFPRYQDKSSSLSALVNKFLRNNGLRPTKDHTVYSLRHSFKDRLVAAEAPDSLIDSLMGHKTYKPKYGKGPPLELKVKFLELIAFACPERL
jgi:integrase